MKLNPRLFLAELLAAVLAAALAASGCTVPNHGVLAPDGAASDARGGAEAAPPADGAGGATDAASCTGAAAKHPRCTLDPLIRATIGKNQLVQQQGVGVAVVHKDQVWLARGYGQRDREKQLPFDDRTLFAIGSTSKAFTAFGLGLLAEEGKLDLNAPISKHLPQFKVSDPAASAQMTATDLLAHRSGLPSHNMIFYFTKLNRGQIFSKLRHLEDDPKLNFRASFSYNNLMYLTAGILTEKLAGKPWEAFVQSRIFTPLKMSEANITEAGLFGSPNHAKGYHRGQPMDYYRNCAAIAPAGCINANLVDMTRWVRMLLARGKTAAGATLLSPKGVAALYDRHNSLGSPGYDYGLGWSVRDLGGLRAVYHSGGLDGYAALVTFIPERELGVIVLVNDHGSDLRYHLAAAIYAELLGHAGAPQAQIDGVRQHYTQLAGALFPPPPAKPKVSLAGATHVATYRHKAYGDLELYLLPGKQLAVSFNGHPWLLTHYSGSTLYLTLYMAGKVLNLPVTVQVDANNVPTLMSIPLGASSNPSVFVRVGTV